MKPASVWPESADSPYEHGQIYKYTRHMKWNYSCGQPNTTIWVSPDLEFWGWKQTSEMDSAPWNKPKTDFSRIFLWDFYMAKNFGEKNVTLLVQNSINRHHCHVWNLAMLPLLPNCTCNSITSQSSSICTHKLPETIDKPLDYIGGAGIEILHHNFLGLSKSPLWHLAITIFYPPPVL